MKFMSPICFELSQSKSYPVVGNDGLFFASCPIHCRFMLSLRFVVFFFSGCGGGGGGGGLFCPHSWNSPHPGKLVFILRQ